MKMINFGKLASLDETTVSVSIWQDLNGPHPKKYADKSINHALHHF